jgi:hypothetical protein
VAAGAGRVDDARSGRLSMLEMAKVDAILPYLGTRNLLNVSPLGRCQLDRRMNEIDESRAVCAILQSAGTLVTYYIGDERKRARLIPRELETLAHESFVILRCDFFLRSHSSSRSYRLDAHSFRRFWHFHSFVHRIYLPSLYLTFVYFTSYIRS